MTLGPDPVLPQAAADAIAEEVRHYGQQDLETGGFMLLPRDATVISVVALSGERGILRRRNLFQISERALDRLFTFSDDKELWAPVQFHSHGFEAFLSPTDEEHGLRVEGFTSVVVPTYANPSAEAGQWGWWRFANGRWVRTAAAGVVNRPTVGLVRFDEAGVSAR